MRRCAQSMDIWGLCTVFSFVKYWRVSLKGQPWIITFSWIICPFVDHKTWIFEDDGDKHHPIIYLWWSQIHSDWFCIWLWAQLLYITFSDPPPKKKQHTHTHIVKGGGDAVTYVPDLKSYFLTKIPPKNPPTAAPLGPKGRRKSLQLSGAVWLKKKHVHQQGE